MDNLGNARDGQTLSDSLNYSAANICMTTSAWNIPQDNFLGNSQRYKSRCPKCPTVTSVSIPFSFLLNWVNQGQICMQNLVLGLEFFKISL